ncbi:hypothetical protein DESHY_60232 [Desulforamulus hydrothermalis Lam5 = DSM 18033]|uniref:Uncharacterized protein n=1 Tax=Desulforamulus hydrothermalis Lam5 = DSM 18033 TaxID=1121428 RepID=K8E0N2_9FIRM|nr:hypothetical protein DESHY_60232 [Desulforamulus hydrothermalis Lam5 = DSM 18033]
MAFLGLIVPILPLTGSIILILGCAVTTFKPPLDLSNKLSIHVIYLYKVHFKHIAIKITS